MKRNYIPAIIMLSAGLIDCIFSLYYKLDLMAFTKRLLLVLVIFYILGVVVKLIVDINFPTDVKESNDLSDDSNEEENISNMENIDTEDIT